jgi:hypothetical protein
MKNYTFEIELGQASAYGHRFPVLYAQEFPWVVCQVVATPDESRDEILSAMEARGEYYVIAEGRTDFVIVQASGTTDGRKVEITPENAEEMDKCICDCVHAAAEYWAHEGQRIMKERGWIWK